jgi:drug/metabolite transporter (DMT)-like permease
VPTGRPPAIDLVLLGVGVLGVSTSGPLIAATTAPALAIAFWRNAMAVGVLAPYAALRRGGELRALPRRTWGMTLGAGALLAAHFAAWVPSLFLTSVASSTALVTMQAMWTAVIGRLAGHPVARRAWVGMGIALAGVILVTGVDVSVSGRALLGDVLALVAGVFSGGYVVLGSQVRRTVSTTSYTVICYATCAFVLLVVCLLAGVRLGGYSGSDWTKLVALTVGAQLLGHSLLNTVLRSISPLLVSLAVLLEVPGAGLLAALWLGQVPPLAAIPAVLLILAGIAVVISAPSTRPPATLPPE